MRVSNFTPETTQKGTDVVLETNTMVTEYYLLEAWSEHLSGRDMVEAFREHR